jgi:hypothetical protein
MSSPLSPCVSLMSLPQNRGGNLASAGGKGEELGLEIRAQKVLTKWIISIIVEV